MPGRASFLKLPPRFIAKNCPLRQINFSHNRPHNFKKSFLLVTDKWTPTASAAYATPVPVDGGSLGARLNQRGPRSLSLMPMMGSRQGSQLFVIHGIYIRSVGD
jgi:hypothetical protein